MPHLVEPSEAHHLAFVRAISEREPEAVRRWMNPSSWVPFDIEDASQFRDWVTRLRAEAAPGPHLPLGWVPHTTLWWLQDDKILGSIDIRHALTEHLREVGGHIGYGVRPSVRRQGHGTAMLQAALPVAQRLGLEHVLITCDVDNLGSIRIIEANGGVLEDQRDRKLRYWVPTARR